jgi:hypothetical protein
MTLQKKIWRSVGKNLSFYITGTILTALTIMLWVGAFAVSDTMTDTYTAFFTAYNAEDAQFTADKDISPEQISEIESKFDLQLEQQMYRNVTFSENSGDRIGSGYENARIRILSDNEKLNRACVLSGHTLQTDSDVLISFDYAQAHGVSVGDTVCLCGSDYTVAGLCSRPDYAMLYAEFSDSFPETENFGLAIITEAAMKQLGGYAVYYSIRYNRSEKEADARAYLYEQYDMTEYIPRSSNPRMGTVFTDAESLKAEFSVYSPIIMLVVVAVIAMVLRRCVKRESKTIGIKQMTNCTVKTLEKNITICYTIDRHLFCLILNNGVSK